MCEHYPDLIPVDLTKENLSERIMDDTGGWGVDRLFECSDSRKPTSRYSPAVRLGHTSS